MVKVSVLKAYFEGHLPRAKELEIEEDILAVLAKHGVDADKAIIGIDNDVVI